MEFLFLYPYDVLICIFISVDPLAEDTMTPYQYCGNNPIMYIDPTGMNHHDYLLHKNGSLSMLRRTNSSTHTIYSEFSNNSFIFSRSHLLNETGIKDVMFSSNFLSPIKYDVYSFTNDNTANKFYKFMAKNSNVEFVFFHAYYGDYNDVSYVFTSRKSGEVSVMKFAEKINNLKYNNILLFSHSHDNGGQVPSDFSPITHKRDILPNGKEKVAGGCKRLFINEKFKWFLKFRI